LIDLTKVSTEELKKFEPENMVSMCRHIHCNICCFIGNCDTSNKIERREAVTNELNRRENMNSWKRLTFKRMDMLFREDNTRLLKTHEVEYMVLPTGEWTTMKVLDHRFWSNLNNSEPKVVYRFRPIDRAELAWERCNKDRIGGFNSWEVKHQAFLAGFKAGQE